ncbi:MAG TPA: glycosyltransferase family 39 protein [Candidatus Sulfomarinibacteraceae bacterium]|nr:glycosyltransferase family 39 protein [Candidatus Sulfomarinibacteraceae bacterium]
MNSIAADGKDHPHTLLFVGALLVTLLGFGLRLHHLEGDPFWFDELLTLWTARGGIGDMLAVRDHPPLIYLLTSLSLRLFGESEFTLRLPAVYAGAMAPPLLFAFGRYLNKTAAGLLAAFLLAFAPAHLHHSQEARHYAWLLLFSLASFLLLYRAFKRPIWRRWLAYAALTIVNLYTHYAAFVILAAQIVIINAWLLHHLLTRSGSRHFPMTLYPAGAGAVVLLLYLPWLPRLLNMLGHNIGPEANTSTGGVVDPDIWLEEIYTGFSLHPEAAPLLTLGLVLAGVLVWGWQRDWANFAFSATALILPLVFLMLLRPARGAYSRYIIYLLPFYLFFAAVFLSALLHRLFRMGPVAGAASTTFCVLSIGLIGWGAVEQEYIAAHYDWHGVLQYLDERASEDSVLLMVSFNYEDGWNMAANTLPYYLRQQPRAYHTLEANRIGLEDARALGETTVDVWALVDNWLAHEQILSLPLDVAPFQNDLFVVHNGDAQGTTLEKTLDLYEPLLPLARSPSPQCFLYQDLANLRLATGEFGAAERAHERSLDLCGSLSIPLFERRQNRLELALLEQAVETGREPEALLHARNVLRFDPKHELALKTLTAIDLVTLFQQEQARVAQNGAPEEVRMERFIMPADGDSGDALLIHPPASVAFPLSLPESPVSFSSRVALSPESWNWGGDGATFVVQIQEEDGTARELYRRHVGNDTADHRWRRVELSLAAYAGQDIVLVLATENGPAGDGRGDWAGWERPRILWNTP